MQPRPRAAEPSTPAADPPAPRRPNRVPRPLLYLCLFSILLPLNVPVLGLPTAVQPVDSARPYPTAEAVPPFLAAFDCFHPTAVKTYDITQHCPKLKRERTSLQGAEVYLLQQDFTHRTPGFRCSMTRGIRRFICGAFSYDKALRAPVGQLPVSLSGAECHRLVSTREYKDEKKKTHPIKVPGLNEIAVDEIGWESSSDGDQWCQGAGHNE